MMASVRKYQRTPNGKKGWRIQVSMPPVDGKQKTPNRIFYPDAINPWGREGKAEAMRAELEFRAELGQTEPSDRRKYTFKYVIDRYIRSRTVDTPKPWSPKTEENTVMWRDRIVEHFGEQKLISKVTADDIGEFLGWLMLHGRKSGNGKPLAASTVQRCDDILRAVFAYAMEEELVSESPVRKKHRPARAERDMDPPTKEEIYALAKALEPEPFWHALFSVATTTGARRGEIIGLRWGDIEPEQFRIQIRRNRVYSKGRTYEKLPKSGKEREVSVNSRLLKTLNDFRRHVEQLWSIDAVEPDWYLFADSPGAAPIHPLAVQRWWENDARLRLPNMARHRFHDLRHYVGSELTEAGIGFAEIAAHLGHASPATTADIYAHARKQQGATEAADLL